jgi:hypothetical protein
MGSTAANLLPLNVKVIKAAKAKDGKPTEYRVKASRGLVLVVQTSGKASWYCFYHVRQGSKRRLRKYWIGSRDVTSLGDARQEAARIMRAAEKGDDPVGTSTPSCLKSRSVQRLRATASTIKAAETA